MNRRPLDWSDIASDGYPKWDRPKQVGLWRCPVSGPCLKCAACGYAYNRPGQVECKACHAELHDHDHDQRTEDVEDGKAPSAPVEASTLTTSEAMINHEDAALAILSQAPEVWADKDWPGGKAWAYLAVDILTAQAHATLALVEQQKRTADALERIADRLEGEPVNDSTFHVPYERPTSTTKPASAFPFGPDTGMG